jgi:hypothetical protein
MAFNGSGTFTRLYSWVADKAGGIKIRADKMDAEMDGFATGLSNCITKDGQTTITANIPFNSKKITGLGTPTDNADAATKAYVDGAAFGGNRNKIINGNLFINQRGVSGTVTLAAGAYGHDRWKAGASGCTYTFTTVGLDTTVTITSGSLVQVVEDNNIEGGIYTLSWVGTAQARAAISGGTTTGAYASGPITTGTANSNATITVEFTLGTLTRVQLERGGTATAFERRPYGLELTLCQRYYWELRGSDGLAVGPGFAQTGTDYIISVPFPVPMRISPALSVVNAGDVFTFVTGSGTANAGVAPVLTAPALTRTELLFGSSTTLPVGTSGALRFKLAAQRLGFSAEI